MLTDSEAVKQCTAPRYVLHYKIIGSQKRSITWLSTPIAQRLIVAFRTNWKLGHKLFWDFNLWTDTRSQHGTTTYSLSQWYNSKVDRHYQTNTKWLWNYFLCAKEYTLGPGLPQGYRHRPMHASNYNYWLWISDITYAKLCEKWSPIPQTVIYLFFFLWSCVPWFPVCIITLLLLMERKGEDYKKYTAKE